MYLFKYFLFIDLHYPFIVFDFMIPFIHFSIFFLPPSSCRLWVRKELRPRACPSFKLCAARHLSARVDGVVPNGGIVTTLRAPTWKGFPLHAACGVRRQRTPLHHDSHWW